MGTGDLFQFFFRLICRDEGMTGISVEGSHNFMRAADEQVKSTASGLDPIGVGMILGGFATPFITASYGILTAPNRPSGTEGIGNGRLAGALLDI